MGCFSKKGKSVKERPKIREERKQFSMKQCMIALSVVLLAFIVGGALVTLPRNLTAHAAFPPHILVLPVSANYSAQSSIRVGGSYFGHNEHVTVYWDYKGPGTGTLEAT